jgi:putative endonuclease
MFIVYVLYSEIHNQIYIGYTSDLLNRFKSHQTLATKGHSIKYRPWKVVYLEYLDSKTKALEREKQLKTSRGRNFIRMEVLPPLCEIGFISVS